MTRLLAVLWLALLALASPAAAQTFPQLTGRVVDQANLLRPEQELDLTSKLAALETRTGRQMVVATVASLEGKTIEDYGYRLGRHWKIGDEKRDDGVILLVAPKEKKVRIETGYGARVFLTDVVSGRIIRELILPRFREGDFAGGIGAGADEIIRQMSLSPQEAERRAKAAEAEEARRRSSSGGFGFLPVIFIMVVVFSILGSLGRRAGGRRYQRRKGHHGTRAGGVDPWVILWGLDVLSQASRGRRGGGWGGGGGFGGFGGGGGGGFGGFSGGGGSFGGGGASGGW